MPISYPQKNRKKVTNTKEFVVSLLDADLTPAIEKELLDLGMEVSSVGLGSTEFSTQSKAVFNRVKSHLVKNKINASI